MTGPRTGLDLSFLPSRWVASDLAGSLFSLRTSHAGVDAGDNHRPLELAEHAEHPKHSFASRCGRVDRLLVQHQVNAGAVKLLQACDQVRERTLSATLGVPLRALVGCLRREVSAERAAAKATHGMSQSRLYRTWINLNDRCYNPKKPATSLMAAEALRYARNGGKTLKRFLRLGFSKGVSGQPTD